MGWDGMGPKMYGNVSRQRESLERKGEKLSTIPACISLPFSVPPRAVPFFFWPMAMGLDLE